jgi:glycosyltransferase involved in cell wall biosynthesis
VIPNPIRREDLRPTLAREAIRAELGIPADAFAVVMLAALRREKRPLDFIDAVLQANSVDATIRGFLVGDGVERASVDAASAASHGVVRALGSRRDVGNVLTAADVVCLTSAGEALPVALIEAMAVGKPIVASAVGGIPNLLEDGVSGELVEPYDVAGFARAFVLLAGDTDRRDRLARAALASSHRFNLENSTAAYAELIERVIHRPPRMRRPGRVRRAISARAL